MTNFIVFIDGPMGSGKSSIGEMVHKKLKRTALINRDNIKWFISDYKRGSRRDMLINLAIVLRMCDEYLKQRINLVIPQGSMTGKSGIVPFIRLAKKYNARIYIYHLNAPKKILLHRINHRRIVKEARTSMTKPHIQKNIRSWKQNKYQIGRLFETDKMSKNAISQEILKQVKS